MNFITKERLDRATLSITGELDDMGFYDDAVQDVDVFLVPFGGAYGWQFYGTSGQIHIPSISMSRLKDLFQGRYTSLRDVLRHEYAHAIADTHRGLIRSWHFANAFGGPHTWNFEWEYDPYFHVTEYAAKCPAEDFAEVFMLYLKHSGVLPRRIRTPAISKKWTFVRELKYAVSHGMRRWRV